MEKLDTVMQRLSTHWHAVALCVGLGAFYTVYYLKHIVRKPIIACRDSKYRVFLEKCVPVLTRHYWPSFLWFGSHQQTVGHIAFEIFSPKNENYRSERLTTPDGGEILLHWDDGQTDIHCKQPIVVIIPGLGGDSQSIYVKHLVEDVVKVGFRPVVFNQRGMGGAVLRTPKTFCAGSTDDIHFVLSHIHQHFPEAPLLATGISIGGIILLNYLAEFSSECVPLSGAMTISSAWDLVESGKSLEEPINKLLYNRTLTINLIRLVKTKGIAFRDLFDMTSICKSRTLREFDSRMTVKIFGYRDVNHYYSSSSPKGKLSKITVPTLCLNAADDVFAPLYTIPLDEARQSKNVAIVVTNRGGHVGFMEGILPTGGKTYVTEVFTEFISAIVEESKTYLARD